MFFLPNVAQMKREAEYRKKTAERILRTPKPWSPEMKWEKELGIEAESFKRWMQDWFLFDVTPERAWIKDKEYVKCPGSEFGYTHQLVPKAGLLDTFCGRRKGQVCFTDDVVVPALVRFRKWDPLPEVWMSLTPMEVFTLRPGTKLAKGHTVVAGLGLGYQLLCVCRRRNVTKVTLVERDQALVDWLMPKLREKFTAIKPEIVVGDANVLVPKMQADVALIDIDSGYGYADFPRCPQIGRVWVWGASPTGKHTIWD